MSPKYLLPATMMAAALCAAMFAATPATQQPPAPKGNRTQAAQPAGQPVEEGERIFDQNCSRCHATPEGFPPRISGTILRHMRVRASLSQHDEQELLRYLNP